MIYILKTLAVYYNHPAQKTFLGPLREYCIRYVNSYFYD